MIVLIAAAKTFVRRDGPFKARRLCIDNEWRLDASPHQVFPLLCPIREYEWIEDWSCKLIHSESGVAEKGCIFTTRIELGETWVCSRYEPNRRIEFVVFASRHAILKLDVTLTENGDGTTTALWRRTYTALDTLGNLYVGRLSRERIEREMNELNNRLDHYLRTGSMLRESSRPRRGRDRS